MSTTTNQLDQLTADEKEAVTAYIDATTPPIMTPREVDTRINQRLETITNLNTLTRQLLSDARIAIGEQPVRYQSRTHHYEWQTTDETILSELSQHLNTPGIDVIINDLNRVERERITTVLELDSLNAEYTRRPWTRWYRTNSKWSPGKTPTLHTKPVCQRSDTKPSTIIPEYSGMTTEDMIANHGRELCKICLRESPVKPCRSRTSIPGTVVAVRGTWFGECPDCSRQVPVSSGLLANHTRRI